ncbi:MAG: hypothetical protein IPO21_15555 [Bacteroidales bacterium]|nr:hypothetical protein [Bacteroidales bacterium]
MDLRQVGNLLWYTDKLTDKGEPAEAWDGLYGNEPLTAGAYFYKCEAKYRGNPWKGKKKANGRYTKMGSVYIVR